MASDSFLDKLILWFKNNRFFAVLIFLALVVVAASKLIDAIDSLLQKGRQLTYSSADTSFHEPITAKPVSAFADLALSFGSAGIGPRMFTDARAIALDGHGNIYVAEYQGGRIQLFDSTGTFVTQWYVRDTSRVIFGMTVDRQGTVFVASADTVIDRYQGATGRFLGQLQVHRHCYSVTDVKLVPGGDLVVALDGPDDLVRLNSDGQVVQRIDSALSSRISGSVSWPRVAVDGAGNAYAVGFFGAIVVKYSSNGRFLNRFGGEGLEPGQLHGTLGIAVDGKGRVFVSDQKGIQVFDSEGRYLALIPVPAQVFGMVFSDTNDLFAAAGDRVLKFTIRG